MQIHTPQPCCLHYHKVFGGWDGAEVEYGSLSTRLYRALQPRPARSSAARRLRTVCCCPSLLIYLACFGLTMAVIILSGFCLEPVLSVLLGLGSFTNMHGWDQNEGLISSDVYSAWISANVRHNFFYFSSSWTLILIGLSLTPKLLVYKTSKFLENSELGLTLFKPVFPFTLLLSVFLSLLCVCLPLLWDSVTRFFPPFFHDFDPSWSLMHNFICWSI